MKIDEIKRHGATLGLQAELKTRLRTLDDCYAKGEWSHIYSHAMFIGQLAEELRKLDDEGKKTKGS